MRGRIGGIKKIERIDRVIGNDKIKWMDRVRRLIVNMRNVRVLILVAIEESLYPHLCLS